LTLCPKAILTAPVNPRDASLSLETETGFFPMNARATADCTRRASFFKRNLRATRGTAVDARAPHAMFRALRARGGAGADGGGRSLRRRVRRGVLGLICLAVAAYSARAAFSGSAKASAFAVYHGIFPGTGGRGSADLSRVAALAASTAASTASGAASVGAYRRPVVLVVGDSLVQRGFETNGWVASLARAYARVADVINRGYSGYNTRWVRDLMTDDPGLFPPRRDVALAVILLGANDAARPEGRKSRYATRVEEYEENLRWIVSRFVSEAEETTDTRVVLCTPPPIDEEERLRITTEQRGMPADLLDRDAERAAAYADAARRVGENTRVAVADLHAAFLAKGRGWEKALLSDGLHFNQQGQALAFETVFDAIPPEVRPGSMRMDAPTHDALVGNATDDWHGHLRDGVLA
jgi:lysophospholipase L1-like esterase